MTFDEATAHMTGPVIVTVSGVREVREGEIVRVDETRHLVLVRLRRKRMPYDFTGRTAWYHPSHLAIPTWWRLRQADMPPA